MEEYVGISLLLLLSCSSNCMVFTVWERSVVVSIIMALHIVVAV